MIRGKKGSDSLEKISGAVFTVYEDTNGNGKFDKGTDLPVETTYEQIEDESYAPAATDNGKMNEFRPGEHEMGWLNIDECKTYFVLETKAPQGYKLNDHVYTVKFTEDGQTVTVHDLLADCVYNDSMTNLPSLGSMGLLKIVLAAAGLCLAGFVVMRRRPQTKPEDEA